MIINKIRIEEEHPISFTGPFVTTTCRCLRWTSFWTRLLERTDI